jgi:signal transduction histidine kinase
MNRRRRYWHLILFLGALVLPSVLVAWLGWRNVTLDRQNRLRDAQASAADASRRARADIARDLWERLESIKVQAIENGGPPDPAVRFVAWVDGDRLVMPWETDPNAALVRRAVEESEFAAKIDEAERAEFTEKLPDRAAIVYRDLLQTANDDQRAYARLKLASALHRAGSTVESDRLYRDLLNLPSNFVDKDGFSYASVAALALAGAAGRDVLARAARDLESPAALTLDQAYRWRDVLGGLQKSETAGVRNDAKSAATALAMRIAALEQAYKELEPDPQLDQLRKEFASLGVTDKAWRPYGNLLISRTFATAPSRPMLIAVRLDDIFGAVQAARNSESFTLGVDAPDGSPDEPSAEPLDEHRLPGLAVAFGPSNAFDAGPDLRRSLYAPALLLVVVLIFLGGYLLWRDTRREVHTAELRSQFVASVSHELKTPLTAIRMFAEIMQGGDVDSPTRNECVDTIVNESERLTRLLNNVLDFSRIEHGQKTYRLEPTRLSEVVAAAAKTMQHPLAEQGFDLSMEIDDQIPPVPADRDALKQAVLNLLTNAMKYSSQSREIQLRLLPRNGDALIQVSDRGIGIPKQEQSRIFEKFYRAPVRENQSISGTGLGLALVAHIVQGHSGSVQVESSPGAGSTFTIRLPLTADANDARSETAPGVYRVKGAST